jgi:hypothetical protein
VEVAGDLDKFSLSGEVRIKISLDGWRKSWEMRNEHASFEKLFVR